MKTHKKTLIGALSFYFLLTFGILSFSSLSYAQWAPSNFSEAQELYNLSSSASFQDVNGWHRGDCHYSSRHSRVHARSILVGYNGNDGLLDGVRKHWQRVIKYTANSTTPTYLDNMDSGLRRDLNRRIRPQAHKFYNVSLSTSGDALLSRPKTGFSSSVTAGYNLRMHANGTIVSKTIALADTDTFSSGDVISVCVYSERVRAAYTSH